MKNERNPGESLVTQIRISTLQIRQASERLKAVKIDPQVVRDIATVNTAVVGSAWREAMMEIHIPRSKQIYLRKRVREILSEKLK